ncbi:MAG: rhodanese-like domain-containing protein [Planctomycetota bacterium]
MLLKYFYDQKLAHASYLVGCQKTKEAIVIDPGRDIDQYREMAQREGVNLVAVAETHIHADYVSGARELADRFGTKLYLSDEGPAEWKYQFASQYDSQLLKDGDTFMVGNIQFEVMHTPGHTPESISFLLTDQGGGADKPMGIFTGDFVFVGSIGRPDLLEEAAGIKGSAEAGAHQLFHSAERFKQLPDYLQVWPAHGAGSACGKGLGAIPSSTVGYEKIFNPSLQYTDEQAFVQYILSDQPEAPKYFAVMKRVNKEGSKIIGDAKQPELLDVNRIASVTGQATVIDLSPSSEFAAGHVPGTINIPLSLLAAWAGWIVDYSRPVYLIADTEQLPEALRVLRKIGIDQISGLFETSAVREAALNTERYVSESPQELAERIESGEVTLLDVRSDAEWNTSHIPEARHFFLGRLPDRLTAIDVNQPVVVQCQGGARSAIAAGLLQASGINVINMAGGFQAWHAAGLPTAETAHENLTCSIRGATAR